MNEWKKGLLTVAVSSALVACGGGGGSSSGASSSSTLTGTVAKGIVANAKVNVYGADGSLLGSTVTDASGDYEFTLPSSYGGGPVRVEVDGSDGGTMKCDVVTGCDVDGDGTPDAVFGQTVDLPSSFRLEAVVPEVSGTTVSTHVTALTDLAAKLAKKRQEALGTAGPLSADVVAAARSQVANLLGIAEPDLDAKPVDITDPEVIATATVDELRHALYSAAVLGAVMQTVSSATGSDMGAALEKLAEGFAENDGQLVVNDDDDTAGEDATVVSLEDILSEAVSIANDAPVSSAITSVAGEEEGSDLLDDISTRLAESESAAVGSTTDVAPSPTAGSPGIQQARAMIADLRDLAYVMGAELAASGRPHEENLLALVSASEAFGDRLSMAGEATGPAAQYLLQGLGEAAKAMAEAVVAYAVAYDAGTVLPATKMASNGLQVTITADTSNPLALDLSVSKTGFDIDPSYNGTDGINLIDIDLQFSLDLDGVQELIDSLTMTYGTDEDGNPTLTESGGGSVGLEAMLDGSVESSGARLTLLQTTNRPSKVALNINEITANDLRTEQPLITVDGSSGDWNTIGVPWWNYADSVSDPSGETTTTTPATDIEQLLYRVSDLQLAFGIKTAGAPTYPFATGYSTSSYEIEMLMFSDDQCINFVGGDHGVPAALHVRNVTSSGETNAFWRVVDNFNDNVGPDVSLTATSSGDLVEFLIPVSALPDDVGSIFTTALVRGYDAEGVRRKFDETQYRCIPLHDNDTFVQDQIVGSFSIEPSSLQIGLAARIDQLVPDGEGGSTIGASFEGHISAKADGVDVGFEDERSLQLVEGSGGVTEQHAFTETTTASFATAGIQFGGTFSKGTESFDAQFRLTLDGSGFTSGETVDSQWSNVYTTSGDWIDGMETHSVTDNDTGFVTGSAVLSFALNLDAISYTPAALTLTAARDGETTGSFELNLDLANEGKLLNVLISLAEDSTSGDVVATRAVITNQDGVTITFDDPENSGEGTITKGSGGDLEELGAVEEDSSGNVLFRLNDGTQTRVESL